jgi:hypothetical protein
MRRVGRNAHQRDPNLGHAHCGQKPPVGSRRFAATATPAHAFGAITPGLEAPLQSAGGMAALILTHTDRQAALRLSRNRVRITGKPASRRNRRAFGGSVRVREMNDVEARRLYSGGATRLRLGRVRPGGFQRIRRQVLGRRLGPGDSTETRDRQTKAFHRSALLLAPAEALYESLTRRECSRNPYSSAIRSHFSPPGGSKRRQDTCRLSLAPTMPWLIPIVIFVAGPTLAYR